MHPFGLADISSYWSSLFAFLVTVILGLVLSWLTGESYLLVLIKRVVKTSLRMVLLQFLILISCNLIEKASTKSQGGTRSHDILEYVVYSFKN